MDVKEIDIDVTNWMKLYLVRYHYKIISNAVFNIHITCATELVKIPVSSQLNYIT
jgi:hypothetical protein